MESTNSKRTNGPKKGITLDRFSLLYQTFFLFLFYESSDHNFTLINKREMSSMRFLLKTISKDNNPLLDHTLSYSLLTTFLHYFFILKFCTNDGIFLIL